MASALMNTPGPHLFQYSTVTGFFRPSEPGFEPKDYDYVRDNLGLKSSDWPHFVGEVQRLNANARERTCYKVLFLGRHGEGWHNLAERKYGRQEWDNYWAKQERDDEWDWFDAHLTPKGIEQSSIAAGFWQDQLQRGIPAPDSYYTSPLSRCLQTCYGTFGALELPAEKPFRPHVKELLRETLGRHACDRRSTLSELKSFISTFAQPDPFVFEPGTSEPDALWKAESRETDEETQARLRLLLNDIFEHDENQFISLTSHSGAVRAALAVVGHRGFRLAQGSVMAVLVKADRIQLDNAGEEKAEL